MLKPLERSAVPNDKQWTGPLQVRINHTVFSSLRPSLGSENLKGPDNMALRAISSGMVLGTVALLPLLYLLGVLFTLSLIRLCVWNIICFRQTQRHWMRYWPSTTLFG